MLNGYFILHSSKEKRRLVKQRQGGVRKEERETDREREMEPVVDGSWNCLAVITDDYDM